MKPRYYRRDGTPYEGDDFFAQMAKDLEAGRAVKQERLWWGGRLSTVWLGLDHGFYEDGPPLIFETMLFDGIGADLAQQRYSTEAMALRGHQQLKKKWSNPLRVAHLVLARIFNWNPWQ